MTKPRKFVFSYSSKYNNHYPTSGGFFKQLNLALVRIFLNTVQSSNITTIQPFTKFYHVRFYEAFQPITCSRALCWMTSLLS